MHVTAGVITDSTGLVLVTQRPAGKSMAGAWEFPGGKLKQDEPRLTGLKRELSEELGIEVESARPLIRYSHQYPELEVDLDVWRVTAWRGELLALEGQALSWCSLADLRSIGLLPADGAIINALELPDTMAVTPPWQSNEPPLLDGLEQAAQFGRLVCLRCPDLDARSLLVIAAGAACRLKGSGAKLLLHGDSIEFLREISELPQALRVQIDNVVAGFHIPARYLSRASMLPNRHGFMLGTSCHDVPELDMALKAGVSYAFLGNLRETLSHPGQPGMGWQRFEELVRDLPLPVYAIGGLGPEDLDTAWAHGAQGIAAIRSLWPKD